MRTAHPEKSSVTGKNYSFSFVAGNSVTAAHVAQLQQSLSENGGAGRIRTSAALAPDLQSGVFNLSTTAPSYGRAGIKKRGQRPRLYDMYQGLRSGRT